MQIIQNPPAVLGPCPGVAWLYESVCTYGISPPISLPAPAQEQQKELKTHEELSSQVWICTSTHSATKVIIIDAVQPGNILDSFTVCNSHVLCVASVPGKWLGPLPSLAPTGSLRCCPALITNPLSHHWVRYSQVVTNK